MLSFKRNETGATPPVQIPILLFLYTIIFLICVEFVFLFWLQSSLNVAARQVAIKAATNSEFPPEDATNRCQAAVEATGQVFPGYSARVRADYVDAVLNNGKTGYSSFDEIDAEGDLRSTLVGLGAARPSEFWGGSVRGSPGNLLYGGCYALHNPVTNNIVYHTVVHCSGCWPIFFKSMYRGDNFKSAYDGTTPKNTFALSGWLEGRGSYPAASGGATEGSTLNQSLLASGVRPFLVCSENSCDVENGGSQEQIFPGGLSGGTPICPEFEPQGESRPKVNQVSIGTAQTVFSIDQWPASRGRLCSRCTTCTVGHQTTQTSAQYCKGDDTQPSGIVRIANCGDIDDAPLYLVGIRYACLGRDAFGRIMNTNDDPTSAQYLGRCDHYIMLKPACNSGVAPMDKVVGDVTNLDGSGGPCPIRRDDSSSSTTRIVCRNDSVVITNFWNGTYSSGPTTAVSEFTQASTANSLEGQAIPDGTNNTSQILSQGALDGPLDMAMPYHQLCDICNPGSPMCGFYGTCRNQSNLWGGAKTVHHYQVWTNTPFYSLNPMYGQLECKYQRDCMERHCCADAAGLDAYCASRTPAATQLSLPCGNGSITWFYGGVPNRTAQSWSYRRLPRSGGFPHCSTAAVRVLKNAAGECCTADVIGEPIMTGTCNPGNAPNTPIVNLLPPDMSCSSCSRDCAGKVNDKFCPTAQPTFDGACLTEDNFPIGGECIGGPGPSPGSWGTVMPAALPPTSIQCSLVGAGGVQPPGVLDTCVSNSASGTQGNTSVTTTCNTCTQCSDTPIVLSFNSKPTFSKELSCFILNENKLSLGYKLLKGNTKQGFLAFDWNNNGKIDNGFELFGRWTAGRYNPDGYTALGYIKDTNRDGIIKGDELEGLIWWNDLNEDGVSQKSEMKSLKSLNIVELDAGRYRVIRMKDEPKYFTDDKKAYTYHFSKLGFKYKDSKGNIKDGYSWDITFEGEPSEKCLSQNKKKYKKSYIEEIQSFINSSYKWLISMGKETN